MSHYSGDETVVNVGLFQAGELSRMSVAGKSHREKKRGAIHSEPTVELNHPIESGILHNVEDHLDHDSETEEIVFPFSSDPTIEMDYPDSLG
ncbi:MAG TPA: hypothetical protein ENK26_11940 [Gammaproteobacteria bacterium]|nr:hypothetical protein [Gammaproteobacteria bacterium]